MFKKLLIIKLVLFLFINSAYSEVIKEIEIIGNQRLTENSIILFGDIELDSDLNENEINEILIKLYKTNFFEDVSLKIIDNTLQIKVIENPIIQKVKINGIKAKKIKQPIMDSILLKDNNSFVEYLVKEDEKIILSILREKGFYFAKINSELINLKNNTVNLIYNIELGDRAKIKKIKFIGDKKIKARKLKNVIISEESKFWKVLTSKQYLNKTVVNLDKRLLVNYYKNKGYYNVKIDSAFAQFFDNNKFELTYKIDAGNKFFFNEVKLKLPIDYDVENFSDINKLFAKLKGKRFSLNSIDDILKEIDKISIRDQYQFINATVKETIVLNDKINLTFNIMESKKYYVQRINILGNNITRETVIRNKLIVDEGDPFNELLHKRSINGLKSLNFFKTVESEVIDGSEEGTKVINITVDEKPTGEITAGAGVGTNGGTIALSVKENNYLGKGINLNSSITLSEQKVKGILSVTNPNYNGSDKSLTTTFESSENNKLKTSGYKSSKTGIKIGTRYEQFEDTFLSTTFSSFYEDLETDSTASDAMKKQNGSSFDTDFIYGIDYDLRNQKFQPTEGFRSRFKQSLPLINKKNKLFTSYELNYFKELPKEMIGSLNLYSSAITSLNDDDIRLSDRIFLPTNKLRGFERGKVGPVDSGDHIGGNYTSSLNLITTLPGVLPALENIDFSLFFDAANVWGVDYNKLLSDSNVFRSSIGIAIDWFTPIGPLSISFSNALTQADTDVTETFRFNLGTTF